jgi:signal peptidase I
MTTCLAAVGAPVLTTAVGLWLARRRLAVVTISGISMAPTYANGDRVLVRRIRMAQLRVGQVVVFEQLADQARERRSRRNRALPRRNWMIKRVAAIPGDVWAYPGAALSGDPLARAVWHVRVPPGQIAVLGDNRRVSHDSRHLGFIPGDQVLGVVVRRIGASGSRTRWAGHEPGSQSAARPDIARASAV